MARRAWVPSGIERSCLRQLDDAEAWKWLGQERPEPDEPISWAPMRKIFGFNLAVFGPIFVLFGFLGWRAWEGDQARFGLGAAVVVLGVTAAFGGGMAAYATSIYRRSWNRRARSYLEE